MSHRYIARPKLRISTILLSITPFVVVALLFIAALAVSNQEATVVGGEAVSGVGATAESMTPSSMQATSLAESTDETATTPVFIPEKSEPKRIVIRDADIDISVDRLPMSAEQIAQRSYLAPDTPNGYWAQFQEGNEVYYDIPGAGMIDATLIVGHACTLDACKTLNGDLVPKNEWPFTRLADSSSVKIGTPVSIFTDAGEVCSTVVSVDRVGRYDIAAQDRILQRIVGQQKIVLNSCDVLSGAQGMGMFVVAEVRPCGS